MNIKILYLLLIGVVLSACASPTAALPTPTQLVPATPTSISAATVTPLTPTSAPNPSNICTDPQVTALIDSLKTSVLNSDGALLASLVSPTNGMDVRFFRYGTVVNYDQAHAKFLFETTFEVDWGAAPGSGEAQVGSFHDVVIPELVEVFNQPYTLHCNELKHGGASYDVSWPYDKDFYSIYFPGTAANGNLDWHTWVAGIEYVNGKPHFYALTQFFWEP